MKTERDFWTIQAMRNLGRGFVVALAGAAAQATEADLQKIKEVFSGIWRLYESKGIGLEYEYKRPIFYSGDNMETMG